ncbi:hypothetical protein LSM04_003328 [Trypanosoma melophagium]|uniref:uncharacterized protein n=1 Tax=Trypanosoma melophagium TaxID=715481 RepID=UPI00351A5D64|nr:hypothetical protein LSM04_003328 [Trypanosoma melophagium]
MTAVHYSACPIFPGEVEDYYCTDCHTPCSGLALLVGPHTGHSRLPLQQAAEYMPATLRRHARTLQQQIQEEYTRPKAAHCRTLHSTLQHLQEERQQKKLQLERLQQELCELDVKIDSAAQACATALCHWSQLRGNYVRKAQLLLHGADALSKTVGLCDRIPHSRGRSGMHNVASPPITSPDMDSASPDASPSDGVLPPQTIRTIAKELNEVQQLLLRPLESLEREREEEQNPQWISRFLGDDGLILCEKEMEKKLEMRRQSKSSSSSVAIPSDSRIVIERMITTQKEPKVQTPPSAENCPVDGNNNDDDDDSDDDDYKDAKYTAHRQRWRHDIKRKERILREGLNRCLLSDTPQKRRTTTSSALLGMGITGDETDVNDISSSSSHNSGGSVNEAISHLLRRHSANNTVNPSTSNHHRNFFYSHEWEEGQRR